MVNVARGSQSHKPQRSALDCSLIASFALLLLLFLLIIDAYEYATVPGAIHARNKIRDGLSVAGNKIHTSVESMTGLELMTKQEIAEMKLEIEEAREVVNKKHDEVEEIVEKHGLLTPVEKASAQEKDQQEDKKKEIVEAMVEQELGLEKWCGSCKWNNQSFDCDKRVSFMMEKYDTTETEAKEANIKFCSGRRLRGA